jgi:gliding motility-associated lipoprotein GldD
MTGYLFKVFSVNGLKMGNFCLGNRGRSYPIFNKFIMQMIRIQSFFVGLLLISFALLTACRADFSPKPRAYYRIDLPVKAYYVLPEGYPYGFDIPVYARINLYSGTWKGTDTSDYWLNIEFPEFHGRIHLTYKKVNRNLAALVDDAHTYAFKHSVKADAIVQTNYSDSVNRVYGVLFDLKDSINHFLRGALYLDCEPNKDSLAPVTDFIRADVMRMVETLHWKSMR